MFINPGKANTEFQKVLDNAPINPGDANPKTAINLNALLPASKKFYTYAGSLTTPPCTEGVDWYVLRTPIVVSSAQITQFKTLYSGNARVAQNLNGRLVEILR